jgi:hypothetical protein
MLCDFLVHESQMIKFFRLLLLLFLWIASVLCVCNWRMCVRVCVCAPQRVLLVNFRLEHELKANLLLVGIQASI